MFGEKEGSCDHIHGVCKNDVCNKAKEGCKIDALKEVLLIKLIK